MAFFTFNQNLAMVFFNVIKTLNTENWKLKIRTGWIAVLINIAKGDTSLRVFFLLKDKIVYQNFILKLVRVNIREQRYNRTLHGGGHLGYSQQKLFPPVNELETGSRCEKNTFKNYN